MFSPIGSPRSDSTSFSPTSLFEAERKEVIRGSRVECEWTFEFLQLLKGGSKKDFPDCFDGTPIKSKLRNPKFNQDFAAVYIEILIQMELSDAELLAYSSSQREDLLVQINVFWANIGKVNKQNYVQGYDDLLKCLYQRFGKQEAFAGYFPHYDN